ncbi:hypothetical protein [Poritiphilus flavus]|uniref:Uncharacterized protein n=1 Tax=Poritiphilus flavus TaxID=2697053 RepID=A0A6L9E7Z8_9FLAO|nr:hypothetical protein [Poritiphilus flavus]NAS10569.1 hypothetical protein [Poritiphilus flavus]
MRFELIPLLERMQQFYQLPRNSQRFSTYLDMLLGESREDVVLPIAAFNPLGKELVMEKLKQLINMRAEELMQEVISEVNASIGSSDKRTISVGLNLLDDIGGAWSERFTTDYSSKFDFGSLHKRNFCLPSFWTSETLSAEMIGPRTKEYLFRTLYWLEHGKPQSLRDHMDQEVFVYSNTRKGRVRQLDDDFLADTEVFYEQHADSTDHNLIFNFFYGDAACEVLHQKTRGISEQAGFRYADYLADE